MPVGFIILKNAARTTLICLISCLTGNWGMLAISQTRMNNTPMLHHTDKAMQMSEELNLSMISIISLYMLSGLVISILFVAISLKYQNQQSWKGAFKIALNMSFFSMLLMMITEYGIRFIMQPPNTSIMNVIHSLNYFDGPLSSTLGS